MACAKPPESLTSVWPPATPEMTCHSLAELVEEFTRAVNRRESTK